MTPPLFPATLQIMGYPGGKAGAGVYQTLINLMPPHSMYVEPFLGGGAVMRHKRPAAVNVGLDLDEAVIESWSTVAGDGGSRGSLDVAAADGIGRSGGGRSSAGGTGDTCRRVPAGVPAVSAVGESGGGSSFPAAEYSAAGSGGDSRSRWEFIVGDGIEYLRTAELPDDALVYCDPPYLHSTRVCTRHYTYEMTDQQHLALLEVVRGLRCRVMVSGYSSPMYAKGLKGWGATAFQAATRGRPAAEWVWHNFERPIELHDYRFLGESRRERESIRRKQRRWVERLRKMPRLERQAILAAIAEAGRSGGGRSS